MTQHSGGSKLTDLREQRIFFIICWITYFSTYIGRLNFTASLAEMSSSAGFSKSELGMVSTGFFIGYGIFQLIWGFAGDRIDPVFLVFSGIFCSGILNLFMSFASSAGFMIILWTLNGIVQAAVWSPLLKLTVDRLPGVLAVRASIRYATTVPAGTFAAYLTAALCILFGSWRTVFAVSGIFMIAVAAVWLCGMKKLAPHTVCIAAKHRPSSQNSAGTGVCVSLRLLLIPICLAALMNGLIRDGVQTWMPTYLSDQHGVDGFSSVALTLVLPIINLSGVYIGKFVNDHHLHNELSTAGAAFLCAALLIFPCVLGMHLPLWFSLVLFGLCAAMMLAVNTMLVTLVPMQLQHTGRVSALSGILNSATYAGSALSGYGIGWLLEHKGWPAVLFGWLIGLSAAGALCILIRRLWKGFCRSER